MSYSIPGNLIPTRGPALVPCPVPEAISGLGAPAHPTVPAILIFIPNPWLIVETLDITTRVCP